MQKALAAIYLGLSRRYRQRLNDVVHIGVDAQLARNLQRFFDDDLRWQLGVVKQGLGCRVCISTARANGHNPLLRLKHIAVAGDDE